MGYQIAIDGPAGAGKSTIAKLLAQRKGLRLCGHRSNVPGACLLFPDKRNPAGR